MIKKSHLEEMNEIMMWLEDDLSKHIYENRVNWLITHDISYIDAIVKITHPDVPTWNCKKEEAFLELIKDKRKIYLYGAGSFAKRLIPYIDGVDDKKFCFCDQNYQRLSSGFYGYPVCSPNQLFLDVEEKVVIICSTKYEKVIRRYLIENGISPEEILDIRSYFKCGTGDEYFYEDFLRFGENEVFVDAGCFDLSSTIDFCKVSKSVKKVYAFEPDRDNYERCKSRLNDVGEMMSELELIQAGTWDEEKVISFSASSDGMSHIGEGDFSIQTKTIDQSVGEHEKVSFIKMDVEGAELRSLIGAKKTIQKNRPTLAICIYHKPEDMWELPVYIKEIVPEYRLYLRSYSNADNEMVLFAVP